jgi:hypothetical protein
VGRNFGIIMSMFNINKIRAHIKMLEFQEIKLVKYLAETEASSLPTREEKIRDIQRSLKRVQDGLTLWRSKEDMIINLPK